LASAINNRDGKSSTVTTTFSDDLQDPVPKRWRRPIFPMSPIKPVWAIQPSFLAWGTAFLDFDNDGFLDIFIANGHVYPEWRTGLGYNLG